MNFISLFAGIGGFDLGLERAGMKCVGQVEIDPYCQAVLAHHWPNVKRVGDIRDVTGLEFGTVRLVCGGVPCQPFSLAGKRRGEEDNRYLWPEMLRVIKAYRPTWVLGENVVGIVGVELDKVRSDLESIGYQVRCLIIPACAVDALHRRDRVWIVAYSEHNGRHGTEESGSVGARIGASSGQDGTEQPAGSDCGTGGNSDVADSECMRQREPAGNINSARESLCPPERQESALGFGSGGQDVANASGGGFGTDRSASGSAGYLDECSENVPYADSQRREEQLRSVSGEPVQPERICRWLPEPGMGRLAHGIPNRVAQLRALGNAVVPQVVEEIGRAIMFADKQFNERAE